MRFLSLKNVKIYRPLLSFSKSELFEFLKEKNIDFFEDETNEDDKFLRNKIRKFFESFEEKDLIIDRIEKVGEVLKDSKNFEDEVLLEKAKEILVFVKNGSFLIDFEAYKRLRFSESGAGLNFNSNLNSPVPNQLSPSGSISTVNLKNNDVGAQNFDPIQEQKPTYSNIVLKILSLVLTEISGQDYKPRLENLKKFEEDLVHLEKGKKRDFYGCFAKILTKSNIGEVIDFIDEKAQKKIKERPEKFMLVYFSDNNNEEKIEKFDEEKNIENGRFLVDKNGEKEFYFKTILKKIIE